MGFISRCYYDLKPFLPQPVRMGLRRLLVQRRVRKFRHIWPINPAAGRAPEGWPGWPQGKQFALVLTHDVEGPAGLAKCRELMQLEMSLGFRSSFNFIPEGDYRTPPELREELTANGFEVGVHDLHHNGKLYRSRKDFERAAEKINKYLREWNAVGFRSGFMHHKLDWLHALDIQYDMSTFDTDPFEPQPDGMDTIFPFWLERNGRGYSELPYTLAQDSTLFLFLEEKTTALWQSKLDWIAARGGMALLNVHPDYIAFDSSGSSLQYPAALYSEFLRYVQQRYQGQFWTGLPAEVAAHVREFAPSRPAPAKRVCMISYSFYESDNRVMRYAESLAARGDSVDVLALGRDEHAPRKEEIEGVSLSRIQQRQRNEKGKFNYLARILRFLILSSTVLTWRHFRRRYDVIHVHNVPDFLVFAAWFPRLTGARVLLDIHDILPEFFASKFNSAPGPDWYFRRLLQIERASCRFADHVIIANHLWHQKVTARSVSPEKCSVILNFLDDRTFGPATRTRSDDRFIAIFPGGLQWHQGLDIAIRAFVEVVQHLPKAEFHVYGDGNMKEPWLELVRELKLEKHVFFFDPLPIRRVAQQIANADIGIVPKRADSFGNEAYSTKIMEFMSQGIPVVASRTKIDSFYFNDSVLAFFESGNHHELAERVVHLLTTPSDAERLVANGFAYVRENTWDQKKSEYFSVVDNRDSVSGLPIPAPLKEPASKEALVKA